jgi:hypothetical protein
VLVVALISFFLIKKEVNESNYNLLGNSQVSIMFFDKTESVNGKNNYIGGFDTISCEAEQCSYNFTSVINFQNLKEGQYLGIEEIIDEKGQVVGYEEYSFLYKDKYEKFIHEVDWDVKLPKGNYTYKVSLNNKPFSETMLFIK